jgi:Putative MetA-pathway of phenol degradation
MSNMIRFFICLTFAAAIILARQSHALALESTDDIDTNRPSFMDSPLVVPKGSAQFENGSLYQHFQHGQTSYDVPETEVRLGVTKSVEFQMFTPNYFLLHQQSSARTDVTSENRMGVSDLQEAGFKYALPPLVKDLNVAIIGGVTIPTGRQLISGSGTLPVIRIPWTKQLSKNWQAGGMQSITVLNSGRDVQWQNFFLISRAFGARTSVFAEYGGFYTHQAVSSEIAHFGVVRKLNKNNQVDMQWGFGMSKTAPAAFIGVGYSFRIDHVPLLDKL